MKRNAWKFAAIGAGLAASAPVLADALRWAYTGDAPAWVERSRHRWRPSSGPEPTPRVLHELELGRLAGEVQRARAGRGPGLAHRVHATTAAYDSVLLECARALDLPTPRGPLPLPDRTRYDLETSLVAAGVRW